MEFALYVPLYVYFMTVLCSIHMLAVAAQIFVLFEISNHIVYLGLWQQLRWNNQCDCLYRRPPVSTPKFLVSEDIYC